MDLEISLKQKPFEIFGVNIGLSVVIAWGVTAVLIIIMLLLRRSIKHFKTVPKGTQNVLELAVDGIYKFAESKVGHSAEFVAPVILTLMLYIFSTTVVELFGLPPATEDLNCTLAIGLCSLIMVNVTAIRFTGIRGRIKNLTTPVKVVMPIRILTDLIAPVSMGIRLFANVLVGGVIMQLIYSVIPLVVPAAIASYFSFLHVGIQAFVFGLLSLTYIGEAVE